MNYRCTLTFGLLNLNLRFYPHFLLFLLKIIKMPLIFLSFCLGSNALCYSLNHAHVMHVCWLQWAIQLVVVTWRTHRLPNDSPWFVGKPINSLLSTAFQKTQLHCFPIFLSSYISYFFCLFLLVLLVLQHPLDSPWRAHRRIYISIVSWVVLLTSANIRWWEYT